MTLPLPVQYDSLTPRQKTRVRDEYCRIQKGKCWYCRRSLRRNMYPVKHPIHLHHSHEDGLTLGAVHEYCNMMLYMRGERHKHRHKSVILCFADVAFASCRLCEWSETVRGKRDVTGRARMLLKRHIAAKHPKRKR